MNCTILLIISFYIKSIMSCGFSKYELYVIWKICYKNMWCDKHIEKKNLCKGRPKHDIGLIANAVDNLLKKSILKKYPSQGRPDICIPKPNRKVAIEALISHENEYDFINHIDMIK